MRLRRHLQLPIIKICRWSCGTVRGLVQSMLGGRKWGWPTKRILCFPSDVVTFSRYPPSDFPLYRMVFFQFLVVPRPDLRSYSQGVKSVPPFPKEIQRLEPLANLLGYSLAEREPQMTSNESVGVATHLSSRKITYTTHNRKHSYL